MTSLSTQGVVRARLGTVLGYTAGATALAFFGAAVVSISGRAAVPVVAALAVMLAVILLVYGARSRSLSSPLSLMGIPLSLSLAAAMSPTTKIFSDWSPGTLTVAALIVIAPLVGVVGAMLGSARGMPALARGSSAMPLPARLVTVCCVLHVAGAVVLARQFAHVGGPPLLSGNIEQARFAPVGSGLLQLVTDGIPLAMLIATWARVAWPGSFSAIQRRVLELIIGSAPLMIALGGGRITVIVPVLTAFVVAARYIRPATARRLLIVVPLVLLSFSSATFLARHEQTPGRTSSQTVLFNNGDQNRRPILESAYVALAISLGEQLRVVSEMQNARVTSPPFTVSVYFLHRFLPRAVNSGTISAYYAGGWQASTYAGPVLLDFGLLPALLFGVALGAVGQFGYRRFARGRSVTSIWVYAYLAGLFAVAFYDNIFLNFFYPIVDVTVLIGLSRVLVAPTPSSWLGSQG